MKQMIVQAEVDNQCVQQDSHVGKTEKNHNSLVNVVQGIKLKESTCGLLHCLFP